MPLFNITGDDTLTLKNRVIVDLADGTNSNVEFPNDLVTLKTGKNQNTIYAINETGNNCNLTIRVMRGSSDDKFFQSEYENMKRDPASYVLINGQFSKRQGDGVGNVNFDIYTLRGGVISKSVPAQSNAEGDTEQGVSVYEMKFALAPRGAA